MGRSNTTQQQTKVTLAITPQTARVRLLGSAGHCIRPWRIQAKDKSPCSYQCQVVASIHCPAGEWREKCTTLPYAPGGWWKLTEMIQRKKKIFLPFFTLPPSPPPPVSHPLPWQHPVIHRAVVLRSNSHSCFTRMETHIKVQPVTDTRACSTWRRKTGT